MSKIIWKVEGMTCANCALTITKYLEKQGFTEVNVNPLSGDVRFTSQTAIEEDRLYKGIEALGYHAVSYNTQKEKEQRLLKTPLQKFKACFPFTFLLWLPMFIPGLSWIMNPWVQFFLVIPVMVIGLGYFGKSALKSLFNGIPNMNVLIALGSASAFLYSLYITVYVTKGYVYYDSAATIITIVFLGYWMENVAVAKTQEAIKTLSSEQKTIANMIAFDDKHSEQIFAIESSMLRVGDLVLIKSGEKVPSDCKILWGECMVNESIFTGESLPLQKSARDLLIGGSILEDGIAKAQVTAAGSDTILSKIIDLARQAHLEKAPIQKLADKISAVFVPVVIGLAILTFTVNHFYFNLAFNVSLLRSIAVLVIACPCAMGLATPAAIAVGLGKASKKGILFKDAGSLEQFKKIRQVVFDKTGTLTTGKFVITDFYCPEKEKAHFKSICYSLEKYSNHPIAKAIALEWKNSALIKWKKVEEIKGTGINAADYHDNNYSIGSAFSSITEYEATHSMYVKKNNVLLGWIDVEDEIRSESKQVVRYFKQRGIKTILLSGDTIAKCKRIKETLEMDEVYAGHSPQQKVDRIVELSSNGPIAMIGDGINDAAALAKADVGIAVSDASHIAIQNAHVILVNNGLKNLPTSFMLGQQTYTTIQQNLFWAFSYNIIAIPIAASGLLTPGIAAFIMGFSDLILVANSLMLKWKKLA